MLADVAYLLGGIMRRFQVALLATVAVFGFASIAYSADMPVKALVYKAAPVPVYDWSGFYVGGTVGARWGDIDGNVTSALIGTPPVNLAGVGGGNSLDSTALRGSIFAGWNWEVSRQWGVGVEADLGWANKTTTQTGSPYPSTIATTTPSIVGPFPLGGTANDSFSAQTTWDSSARLRAGWL